MYDRAQLRHGWYHGLSFQLLLVTSQDGHEIELEAGNDFGVIKLQYIEK